VPERIATHDPPAEADFVIHADLQSHGMPGRREQLWVKQLAESRFLMRSLPFFTYGIALGDEVSTDETLTIDGVLQRSGHRLIRVAVQSAGTQEFHDQFHPFLDKHRLLHEWLNFGFVAIDLPPGRDVSPLMQWLESRAHAGSVVYEQA
jgi:hypothetical protein